MLFLLSFGSCISGATGEGQFSVTVVNPSGSIDAQVFLVLRDGGYQAGESKDGIFRFTKPVKSTFLLAAAPYHEGEKVSYTGQDKVTITMKPSETRSSVIGNPRATLDRQRWDRSRPFQVERCTRAASHLVVVAQTIRHLASISPSWQWMQLARDSRSTSRKRFRPYT